MEAEIEREEKKSSWQTFVSGSKRKKGNKGFWGGKGVANSIALLISSLGLSKKESIFKSPDTVDGKVGVTGLVVVVVVVIVVIIIVVVVVGKLVVVAAVLGCSWLLWGCCCCCLTSPHTTQHREWKPNDRKPCQAPKVHPPQNQPPCFFLSFAPPAKTKLMGSTLQTRKTLPK